MLFLRAFESTSTRRGPENHPTLRVCNSYGSGADFPGVVSGGQIEAGSIAADPDLIPRPWGYWLIGLVPCIDRWPLPLSWICVIPIALVVLYRLPVGNFGSSFWSVTAFGCFCHMYQICLLISLNLDDAMVLISVVLRFSPCISVFCYVFIYAMIGCTVEWSIVALWWICNH
jgi:hypothetical protein